MILSGNCQNVNQIEIEMRDKCKSICSLMQLRIFFKKVQQHISIECVCLKFIKSFHKVSYRRMTFPTLQNLFQFFLIKYVHVLLVYKRVFFLECFQSFSVSNFLFDFIIYVLDPIKHYTPPISFLNVGNINFTASSWALSSGCVVPRG